jgi:cysteine desulfurase family protein (TIGR01976 family)
MPDTESKPSAMSTIYDSLAAHVRPEFPALTRTIGGRAVAYFDGPGGTQVPRRVANAVADYLINHNANDGWAYRTSVETTEALQQAHVAAAAFVNAASAGEMIFGNNMTTLTFSIARAVGRSLEPGDEIVVTDLDHHADIDPWVALARDYGAVIRRVPLRDNRAALDIDAYEALLGPRTRVVAVGLSSNAFGTINPVARMAAAAHRAGALVFVDAVHAAAHAQVDVTALGADMLAFSAYKVYGPHVGVTYCSEALLERLAFPRLAPQLPRGSRRAESGTLNHEGIVGTTAAISFLASLGGPDHEPLRARLSAAFARLGREEEALFQILLDGLRALPNVQLYEPPDGVPRHPTTSFTVAGCAAHDVAAQLSDKHGIFVSHGNFYAATAVAKIAPAATENGGLVRVGLSMYSTDQEIARLIEALAAMSE